ncbi:alpha/beta-hydrolase [Mycena olivaceomarginata]|uniref:Alpha/beta-hydrolase n=1 Tax=Mycena albidolilacea TaxID=1033008 RepID=A0AAD6YYM6_9AGAR|nr:alpha/beta-hydrolase [Mycena albidolilacea]KAJ7854306.1 alpha/beta-hydrolase [Mycena olivaceomarginata]
MAFKFHRQPQKTFYLAFSVIYLVLRIPVWILRNLLPAWRPRRQWSFGRSLLVEFINAATAIMLQTSLPAPEPLEKMSLSASKTGFVWVEPAPHLIAGDVQRFAELNGVKPAKTGGFWYSRPSEHPHGHKASPGEKVVYHLHGGGFVMGSGSPSFSPSAVMFKGLLEHVPQFSRIFAMEYRLAVGPPFPTANPFPAALIDVISGYRYLVEEVGFEPNNIIIAGDSAGAILAYQLTRHLAIEDFPNLCNAGALLLLSPSADSALRRNIDSMRQNTRSDYVTTWFDAAYGVNALLGSLSSDELDKPWLSPGSIMFEDAAVKGMFERFPPTFILAGEAEMSRDSMRILRDRMKADMGDKVTYVEVANAPHDFLGLTILEPERTEALREIAKWAASLV